jgi:hypothetical protein
MPLFSSEVFEPLVFLGVHFLFVKHSASFFIGGLCLDRASIYTMFDPTSKGFDSAPSLGWLRSLSLMVFVEYRARFASDFDLTNSMFWGKRSFYYCFRVHGLHIIKNLTTSWASLVRKRVQASEIKRMRLSSTTKAHLKLTSHSLLQIA